MQTEVLESKPMEALKAGNDHEQHLFDLVRGATLLHYFTLFSMKASLIPPFCVGTLYPVPSDSLIQVH